MKALKRLLCLIAFSAILIGCGEKTPDFVGVHADLDIQVMSPHSGVWQLKISGF